MMRSKRECKDAASKKEFTWKSLPGVFVVGAMGSLFILLFYVAAEFLMVVAGRLSLASAASNVLSYGTLGMIMVLPTFVTVVMALILSIEFVVTRMNRVLKALERFCKASRD